MKTVRIRDREHGWMLPDGKTSFVDMLMDSIEWQRENYGVEFVSLSETALRVETI